MRDGEVHLEDVIAMEQVAQKLWQQTTNGTDQGWQALSVLAKQAWRNRARMEVTIRRRKSVSHMRQIEQQVSVERVAEIMWQRGNDSYPAVQTHLAWLALPEDEFRYWCNRAEKAIEAWRRATARNRGTSANPAEVSAHTQHLRLGSDRTVDRNTAEAHAPSNSSQMARSSSTGPNLDAKRCR